MEAEQEVIPDPKQDINYRGQYPPVAILANARRALSHSYNSTKRKGEPSDTYRQDMLHAYREILAIEAQIRLDRNIPGHVNVPQWVFRAMAWHRV